MQYSGSIQNVLFINDMPFCNDVPEIGKYILLPDISIYSNDVWQFLNLGHDTFAGRRSCKTFFQKKAFVYWSGWQTDRVYKRRIRTRILCCAFRTEIPSFIHFSQEKFEQESDGLLFFMCFSQIPCRASELYRCPSNGEFSLINPKQICPHIYFACFYSLTCIQKGPSFEFYVTPYEPMNLLIAVIYLVKTIWAMTPVKVKNFNQGMKFLHNAQNLEFLVQP